MARDNWRECPKCRGTRILHVNPGYPASATYACIYCNDGTIPPFGHWFGDGCDADHTKVTVPCRAVVEGNICGLSQQKFEHQCVLFLKKQECDDGYHHRFLR